MKIEQGIASAAGARKADFSLQKGLSGNVEVWCNGFRLIEFEQHHTGGLAVMRGVIPSDQLGLFSLKPNSAVIATGGEL